jgi:hypothetical protein
VNWRCQANSCHCSLHAPSCSHATFCAGADMSTYRTLCFTNTAIVWITQLFSVHILFGTVCVLVGTMLAETAWNPSCRKTWLMLSGFTSVLWCGYRLWNKPWSIPRAVSTIRLFCCRYHRLYMKFLCVIQNKSRKTLFFSETRSHLENQDLIKVLQISLTSEICSLNELVVKLI